MASKHTLQNKRLTHGAWLGLRLSPEPLRPPASNAPVHGSQPPVLALGGGLGRAARLLVSQQIQIQVDLKVASQRLKLKALARRQVGAVALQEHACWRWSVAGRRG